MNGLHDRHCRTPASLGHTLSQPSPIPTQAQPETDKSRPNKRQSSPDTNQTGGPTRPHLRPKETPHPAHRSHTAAPDLTRGRGGATLTRATNDGCRRRRRRRRRPELKCFLGNCCIPTITCRFLLKKHRHTPRAIDLRVEVFHSPLAVSTCTSF